MTTRVTWPPLPGCVLENPVLRESYYDAVRTMDGDTIVAAGSGVAIPVQGDPRELVMVRATMGELLDAVEWDWPA